MALVSGDPRIPLARLCARLAVALQKHVSLAVLTGQEVPTPPAEAEPAAAFGPLLDRAEAAHDLVLLDARSATAAHPWTEFCLQQADPILVLTTAVAPPPGWWAPELRGCDLVACDAVPGALGEWAAALEPIESHRLRHAGSTMTCCVARR